MTREPTGLTQQLIGLDLGVLRLQRVLARRNEDWIVEIVLVCSGRAISVRYLDDLDELSLAVIATDAVSSAYEDVSSAGPWSGLVGREFCVRWAMTNSQGYEDGIVLGALDDSPLVILIATGKINVFGVG